MSEVNIIGIDLAKRVFQVHGAHSDGSVVFRKRLRGSIRFLQCQRVDQDALVRDRLGVALQVCQRAGCAVECFQHGHRSQQRGKWQGRQPVC